jgi:osmoprotectant transport system substrate-binding protein
MQRMLKLAAIGATAAIALAGCSDSKGGSPLAVGGGGGSTGTVTVGSANFPENVLLAEIYSQALEAKGITVKRQFNIGSREIIYGQIKAGNLTVLPEYNGALLSFVDKTATQTSTSDVDAALTAQLPSSLEILTSSQAQDNDSLCVTAATAGRDNLKTISDLAPYASSMSIGAAPEFETRTQGLIGLKSDYGLTFAGFKSLDTAGPITIAALRTGDVQVADIFSTDPSIVADHFTCLTDPKNVFGVENVTPLVYKAGLGSKGTAALDAVSAKLDTGSLTTLLSEVVTGKQDPSDVARAWLVSVGLG